MKEKTGLVIFSGYNQRAIIAFLRTLKVNGVENYVIIARDNQDQILMTEYSVKVMVVRKDSSLSVGLFGGYADRMGREYGWDRFLVVPSTEGLNRFLLEERETLEKTGYIIPLADKDLYVSISDKRSFARLCQSNGFLIPNEIVFPDSFQGKFVAKPVTYRFNKDNKVYTPVLIRNEEEYDKFRRTCPLEAYYFQEYLEDGDCIYLLYYFSKDNRVYYLPQKNIAQQDDGGSMIISEIYGKNIDEDGLWRSFFKKNGFNGFLMIEMRKYNDKSYVIEANPRFWGPSQLFVDSGYNLFEAFLSDWGVIQKEPDKDHMDKKVFYYWSGGRINDIKAGKKSHIYVSDKNVLDSVPEMIDKYDIYRRDDTIEIWRSENA